MRQKSRPEKQPAEDAIRDIRRARVSDGRAKYQPQEVVHSVSTRIDWTASHQSRRHGTHSS